MRERCLNFAAIAVANVLTLSCIANATLAASVVIGFDSANDLANNFNQTGTITPLPYVQSLTGGQPRPAQRDVDPAVAIPAASLQQQHLDGRVFRKPIGQHAARRPCADDDEVVMIRRHGSPKIASVHTALRTMT